jgi:5'-3' exonuclease
VPQSFTTPQAARGWTHQPYRHFKIQSCFCLCAAFGFQTLFFGGVTGCNAGNTTAANECFQKAVDITPWMAAEVVAALRAIGVTCIVAPYEADCQMAYLALNGFVHAIITEDSDMLVYGCPRVRTPCACGMLQTKQTGLGDCLGH